MLALRKTVATAAWGCRSTLAAWDKGLVIGLEVLTIAISKHGKLTFNEALGYACCGTFYINLNLAHFIFLIVFKFYFCHRFQ